MRTAMISRPTSLEGMLVVRAFFGMPDIGARAFRGMGGEVGITLRHQPPPIQNAGKGGLSRMCRVLNSRMSYMHIPK